MRLTAYPTTYFSISLMTGALVSPPLTEKCEAGLRHFENILCEIF